VLPQNFTNITRSVLVCFHGRPALLSRMNEAFKDPAGAEPDGAGAENLRFLHEMYEVMDKAETET